MVEYDYKPSGDEKVIKMYRIIEVATAILVAVAIFFANHILTSEFVSAERFLHQSNVQTASNLKGRIMNSTHEMEVLAARMTLKVDNFTQDEVRNFLEQHVTDYDYYKLAFAYPDGKVIRYEKSKGSLPDDKWIVDYRFQKALNGKAVFIATLKNSGVPCGYVNSFYAPVHDKNGNVVGIIASLVDAANYLRILSYNTYDGKGSSFIISENGNFILIPKIHNFIAETGNFFDRDLEYDGLTKEDVKKLLIDKDSGAFSYKLNNQRYIAAFTIIQGTNFYVLTTVPLNVLMLNAEKLLWGITAIVVMIGFLLIGLLYYSSKIFKEKEKIIYHAAFVDTITGFSNKNKFNMDADHILNTNPGKNYAMICVEIKKFKALEELYGSERCEQILKDFVKILRRHVFSDSIFARDYSSNFVILYRYENKDNIVTNFIEKVLDEINIYNEHHMQLPSSNGAVLSTKLALAFGVYLISDREITVDQMSERAYAAKKAIKENALLTYNFYDDSLLAQILADKEIEDEMYDALQDNQFKMFLQPKFSLLTGRLAGAEALVRWFHPTKGMIPPIRFIPLFERNGFVIQVDMEIWKQACMFLQERKQQGKPLFPISVNVSRLHMNNDAFIEELARLIQKYNIEPQYLELELTESACFNNENRFKEIITKLKDLGFTISMDDFGTGYSSLNMLRDLPIDVLKLDRGFIKDTISDTKGQIVTRSIIEMANKLNMITVSEGIETEEQANFLRAIGCKIAQGFLYGKPVSLIDFKETFLQNDSNIQSHYM